LSSRSPRTALERGIERFLRPLGSIARRRRLALAVDAIAAQPVRKPAPFLVPRHFEPLARVLMCSARAPAATSALPFPFSRAGGALVFGRFPQPPAREPHQHRVGVA
jgi:hypothetical protein